LNSQLEIRIGIVDVDSEIRTGRRLIIDSQPDFKVVYESDDAASALEKAPQLLVDVMLVDHRLRGMDGVQLVQKLIHGFQEQENKVPSFILTGPYFSKELQLASIFAGATDLVTADVGADQLIKALRSTSAKDDNPDYGQLAHFLSEFDELPQPPLGFQLKLAELDEREATVLDKFKWARDENQISEELNLPKYRVLQALDNAQKAFGFATRAQLFLALYPSRLS
jgi:DNA-binding NarL/FixJ family response regulator